MSTIHRPALIPLWWYAVAAVLAALVATLVVTVLHNGLASGDTGPAAPAQLTGNVGGASRLCFAHRLDQSPELSGVCAGGLR